MSEESIPHDNLETVGLVTRGVGRGGSVNTRVQGSFWVARLIENIQVKTSVWPWLLVLFAT